MRTYDTFIFCALQQFFVEDCRQNWGPKFTYLASSSPSGSDITSHQVNENVATNENKTNENDGITNNTNPRTNNKNGLSVASQLQRRTKKLDPQNNGADQFYQNPMLEFSLNLIQKDSPEYKEVSQSIDVHFNQLYLTCTRETVVAIVEYITSLTNDLT